MKKIDIKYVLLIIFFCILLFLSPISGDDWGNYLEGSQGIRHIFGNAIGMYFDWEGRFISRILINFFTYYKSIWNIVNAIMMVGIIYLINKIINPKNKKTIFFLSTGILLLMNIFTFSQVVVWIAGNITYLFVIPIMLFYFYNIRCKKEKKNNPIVFSILNIIMPMFVEHMGVVLVLGNILILIEEFIKTKKLKKILLIYLLCSILGLLLMICSPGSMKRNEIENIEFNGLSLLEKIRYNLPNFIYYTYFINTYLVILMTVGNYYFLKQIKNKIIRVIGYIYLLPFPIIIVFTEIMHSIKLSTINSINQNNIFLILYFITHVIFSLLLIYLDFKKRKKSEIIFFYILGMAANLVMLLSPTWGFRTSFGTYIFLCISYLLIIDQNIKEKPCINHLLLGIIVIMISFYSVLYISVARQNRENIKLIEKQKKSDTNVIKIRKYPHFVNCNINPENSYHLEKFKQYYQLDTNIEIKLLDNNWKYFVFYQKP